MKKPKENHPWRVPTSKSGYKIPAPDELYFYDDLDDLPIMSNSELVEHFEYTARMTKQEDNYD